MADATPTSNPLATLTTREQEYLVAGLRNLKNAAPMTDIDWPKFQAETGLATIASARARWNEVRKKVFGDAKSGSTSSAAGAGEKPKAARKAKDPSSEAKTPKATKSATKKTPKSNIKIPSDEDDNDDVIAETPDAGDPTTADETAGKVALANGAGESDTEMTEVVESVEDKGKGKGVANELPAGSMELSNTGDMSPPPTPTPAPKDEKKPLKDKASPKSVTKKKATSSKPTTPASKLVPNATNGTPATPNTTNTGAPSSATPKKRGRKTKTQKEAEGAAAAAVADEDAEASGGEAEKPAKKQKIKADPAAAGADDDEVEKPAKKPRKTPVKKSKKEDSGDEAASPNGDPETPNTEEKAKKPRKPAGPKKDPATPKAPTAAQKAKAAKEVAAAQTIEDAEQVAAEEEAEREDVAAQEKAEAERIAAEAAEANDVLLGRNKIGMKQEVQATDEEGQDAKMPMLKAEQEVETKSGTKNKSPSAFTTNGFKPINPAPQAAVNGEDNMEVDTKAETKVEMEADGETITAVTEETVSTTAA